MFLLISTEVVYWQCYLVVAWLAWCHMKLLPSWHKFCVHHTTMHQFPVSLHTKPHGWVHVCLAVICHLHFWRNDQDLLRATAVPLGWNGYWNKSQHRKLNMEKKILLPLRWGLKPKTFLSWVWRSNHWAITAPCYQPLLIKLIWHYLPVYWRNSFLK